MRIGLEGRSVMRMRGDGALSTAIGRTARSSTARIATPYSMLNPAPMQLRGPAPNGM